MTTSTSEDVVVVFLRNDAEILLTRHDGTIEYFNGYWTGLAQYVNNSPQEAANSVIADITGLLSEATLVRSSEPISIQDSDGRKFIVHSFLFDCESRETGEVDKQESAWVPASEILQRNGAPGLWDAYDSVRPSPKTVANDTEHGSAYISIRAMEVLRDTAAYVRAKVSDHRWEEISEVAEELLKARPSMTALTNRVNRIMSVASEERTAESVLTAANQEIESSLAADRAAAEEAMKLVEGDVVLTLSRSGTLYPVLANGPAHVLVAESRPAREGVGVAERLAKDDVDVTLFTDAAIAHVLETEPVDSVLVGSDTILPDGAVVNKTGTRGAAIAASDGRVPVYVVTASDKIAPERTPELETGPSKQIYDGNFDVEVLNPTFDITPGKFVTSVVTDRGKLETEDVTKLAEEFAELSEWKTEG